MIKLIFNLLRQGSTLKPTTWLVEPKGLAWLLIQVQPQDLVELIQKWNMMNTKFLSVRNVTLFLIPVLSVELMENQSKA